MSVGSTTRIAYRPRTTLHARFIHLAAGAVLAVSALAQAQTAPLQSREVPWQSDSGMVSTGTKVGGHVLVYNTTVFVPRSAWLRLNFGDTALPGAIEEGRGAYLRITSLADNAVQYLNSESLRQWANTSAYFNGDAVRVELFAHPGVGQSRVSIRAVTAGEGEFEGPDSICGNNDDRVLSSDPRSSRHLPEGCSTWLFNDTNRTFLTAGHCGVSNGDVQQFNVPMSTAGGGLVNPSPEDQYPVDSTTVQNTSGAVGADAAYFACFPNSNTGLTAFQKQQQHYTLRAATPAFVSGSGQVIRITGYGSTTSSSGSNLPLNQNQVQKTHAGPYLAFTGTTVRYQTDTTGGNSGSAVEYVNDNTVIGIHTHGGCTTAPGTSGNAGTALNFAALQGYLSNPRTLCLSGKGVVTPPLYAIGDGQNNFGTVNTATGNFAKVAFGPVRMEGLAYNPNSGLFYGINNDTYPATLGKRLYTINPGTGAVSTLGLVTGVVNPINGLGFDPATNTLYGVQQANGQLCTINTASLVATPIGPTNPTRTIGALEFSSVDNALYGLDDAGGTKLLRWTDPTQAPTQVGTLLIGVTTDCNGLAVTDDGNLWTINASNEQLLRVNAATGAATVIGSTGGIFGASFGMSAITTVAPPSCYANCDGSTGSPTLTANDFQCFLDRFAQGDSYANCDGSTGTPALTANDFQCFLNEFAGGCS